MKKSLQKCYSEFLGSGNREAEFWFVGIEPGGNPFDEEKYMDYVFDSSEETLINYLNQPFCETTSGSQVYKNVFNILEKLELFDNFCSNSELKKINFDESGNAFYTNLSFLKFPSLDSSNNNKILKKYSSIFYDFNHNLINESDGNFDRMKLFSFGNSDYIKTRKDNLNKYLMKSPKKIVFIITKGYVAFAKILLGESNFENELSELSIKVPYGHTEVSFFHNLNTFISIPNFVIETDLIDKICLQIEKLHST